MYNYTAMNFTYEKSFKNYGSDTLGSVTMGGVNNMWLMGSY